MVARTLTVVDIVAACGLLYVLAAVAINAVVFRKRGWHLIPHADHVRALCGLVTDGCIYARYGCAATPPTTTSSSLQQQQRVPKSSHKVLVLEGVSAALLENERLAQQLLAERAAHQATRDEARRDGR
eukprot:COSAG05_NODE_1622_length_4384_cov_2.840607_3_plen_128_part_00